jgi:oxygen-independent coproporphyrinogen-3 oxidase
MPTRNLNPELSNAPANAGAFPVPAPVTSLYVHVPFCAHKCEYCAFYSKLPAADMVSRYVAALIREMELVADQLRPRTVFFGGGTPSILSLSQWRQVLEAMDRLNLLGAEEWTVECNPATVSEDKAKLLRDYGVNRISMGVQSMDTQLLERLGRIHSREQVFKSYEIMRAAGFDNINLDLMFGIPTQTLEIWRNTLHEIISLGTEHLSCYEVIYEEDTPLFAQLKAGKFDVDEDLIETLYETLVEESANAGFRQYEIANFAKDPDTNGPDTEPTRACKHNTNYWRGGSFHALGPSATGFVGGTRTKNWSNTQLYCEQLEKGKRAIESSETLPPLASAAETAAFGLRMNRGWQYEEFQTITGHDLEQEWSTDMNELVEEGLAIKTPTTFRLNKKGLRFADHAASKFLRPENSR